MGVLEGEGQRRSAACCMWHAVGLWTLGSSNCCSRRGPMKEVRFSFAFFFILPCLSSFLLSLLSFFFYRLGMGAVLSESRLLPH